jgi:hypothetical protein
MSRVQNKSTFGQRHCWFCPRFFGSLTLFSDHRLLLTLTWKWKEIQKVFSVSRQKFGAAEPGDAVHLVVHPGAFLQAWYSDVIVDD